MSMSTLARSLGLATAVLLLAVNAAPAAADTDEQVGRDPLRSEVLTAPSPVPATDGQRHLVYEILVRNDSSDQIRVDRLDVRDPAGRRTLATLDARTIERLMFVFNNGTFTNVVEPGHAGFLLLDVRLKPGERVPARLEHRFGLVRAGSHRTVVSAPTPVDERQPARISPPLHGPDIFALGCCGVPFAHRLALFDFNGSLVLAQRYAIDFVRVDDKLSSFAGDPTRNESYYIFGAEITAVASGRVVAARDGIPENTPPNLPPNPPINDLVGNFVIQDIGGGRFAVYAHLQTGSVRVKAGDRVGRGQVLGRVGNTGNSSEPHLHFHVMGGPGGASGLEADGVPYVFDRFRYDWRVVGLDANPPAPVRVPAPPPHRRTGQYLLTGDIVTFPGAG